MQSLKIGFDLDNTIVDYSRSVYQYCKMNGLPEIRLVNDLKTNLRKTRSLSDPWTKAQAWLYTEGLKFATLTSGIVDGFKYLTENNVEICIHSHKTESTPLIYGATNLRKIMDLWLQRNIGENIVFKHVHYSETLDKKITSISECGLNYFVDDLEDVLQHLNFPDSTFGIHYISNKLVMNTKQTNDLSSTFFSKLLNHEIQ